MKIAIRRTCVLLAILLAFGLGCYVREIREFARGLSEPHIFSDSAARVYGGRHCSLPDKAYRLYAAYNGFGNVDWFWAFSADRAAVEEFLRNSYHVRLDQFSRTHVIPGALAKRGPDSWRGYSDANWDLRECNEFLVYNAEKSDRYL